MAFLGKRQIRKKEVEKYIFLLFAATAISILLCARSIINVVFGKYIFVRISEVSTAANNNIKLCIFGTRKAIDEEYEGEGEGEMKWTKLLHMFLYIFCNIIASA